MQSLCLNILKAKIPTNTKNVFFINEKKNTFNFAKKKKALSEILWRSINDFFFKRMTSAY